MTDNLGLRGQPLRSGIDYPNEFSLRLLNDYGLDGATVLDCGCGDNAELGKQILGAGARLLFSDIDPGSVATLTEAFKQAGFANFVGQVADTTVDLQLSGKSIDVTHERFVLMHLPADKQEDAIREQLRVTMKRALFLEYDYRSFHSVSCPDQLALFMEPFDQTMAVLQVDRHLGEHLLETVQSVAKGLFCRQVPFCWPEGRYTYHLIELCERFIWVCGKYSYMDKIGGRFKAAMEELRQNPITFTPPTINAVIVEMR